MTPHATSPATSATGAAGAPAAASVVDRARRAPGVSDLGDGSAGRPGSAASPAGPDGLPEHVWYASYGSNLLRERFEVYLLGGRIAGLDRLYPGGPGTTGADADRAVVLPGGLRFALEAPAWGGGGVAFWDPAAPGPGVLARAWRVRLQQFLEVVHLENGGLDRRPAAWSAEVLTTGEAAVGDGWYSRLLCPGHLGQEPVLTFTHPRPASLTTREPSSAYAGVVGRGLLETFGGPRSGGLGPDDVAAYLGAALRTGDDPPRSRPL